MVLLRASWETWLRKKVWSLKLSAAWRSFTAAKSKEQKSLQELSNSAFNALLCEQLPPPPRPSLPEANPSQKIMGKKYQHG